MTFLMLYLGQDRRFDRSAITAAMHTWAVHEQASDGYLATYSFSINDDFTTIRLNRDLETIVIDGSGDASLAAALNIQSRYSDNIRIFDEAYSFDFDLAEVSSLSELKRRIRIASG